MGTNREARGIAMECSSTREYDPETDILYVGEESFTHFTGHLCQPNGASWVSRIRHLAIPLAMSDAGLSLPLALPQLTSLQTISIVYPKPSGEVGCFDTVAVPEEKGAALRPLTAKERSSLTVTADYSYDTWAGAFPVRWKKNANEHLDTVEVETSRRSGPGNGSPIPSVWDYTAKRLALRYEARCFEPLG